MAHTLSYLAFKEAHSKAPCKIELYPNQTTGGMHLACLGCCLVVELEHVAVKGLVDVVFREDHNSKKSAFYPPGPKEKVA